MTHNYQLPHFHLMDRPSSQLSYITLLPKITKTSQLPAPLSRPFLESAQLIKNMHRHSDMHHTVALALKRGTHPELSLSLSLSLSLIPCIRSKFPASIVAYYYKFLLYLNRTRIFRVFMKMQMPKSVSSHLVTSPFLSRDFSFSVYS